MNSCLFVRQVNKKGTTAITLPPEKEEDCMSGGQQGSLWDSQCPVAVAARRECSTINS